MFVIFAEKGFDEELLKLLFDILRFGRIARKQNGTIFVWKGILGVGGVVGEMTRGAGAL